MQISALRSTAVYGPIRLESIQEPQNTDEDTCVAITLTCSSWCCPQVVVQWSDLDLRDNESGTVIPLLSCQPYKDA